MDKKQIELNLEYFKRKLLEMKKRGWFEQIIRIETLIEKYENELKEIKKKEIISNLNEIKGSLENMSDVDIINDRMILLSLILDTLEVLENDI